MNYRSISIDGPPGAPVDEVYNTLLNHLSRSECWTGLTFHADNPVGDCVFKAETMISRLSGAPKTCMVFKRHLPHIISLVAQAPGAASKELTDKALDLLDMDDLHVVIVPTLEFCAKNLNLDTTVVVQRRALMSSFVNKVYAARMIHAQPEGNLMAISQEMAPQMSCLTISREIIKVLRGAPIDRYDIENMLNPQSF